MTTIVPFGHWPSPLQPDDVAAGKVSLSDLCSDGTALYWLESRPTEAGRVVFVRAHDGTLADHSPAEVSIRSRVHEYGGGAVCLVPGHADGTFAYVDQADQQVYLCDGATPKVLTALRDDGGTQRHGGLSASADGDWVLAVREIHPPDGSRPARQIVAFSTRSARPHESILVRGHDFFSTARLRAGGDRLAVVAWDHPDMQWDASSVVVVPIGVVPDPDSGLRTLAAVGAPFTVAGGPEESVGQPAWQRDGTLRLVSDRRGWWQPYAHPGLDDGSAPQLMADEAAEFHGPDWVLGQSTMAELADGTMVARLSSQARQALVVLDPAHPDRPPRRIGQPCVAISAVSAHGDGVAFIGATPDRPANVWVLPHLHSTSETEPAPPLRPAASGALAPADVALAEPFKLSGRSGRPIYGSLYRPVLSNVEGPAEATPPLIVWCHGGPTSSHEVGLDLGVQFFATRGFAVACVDYAGSTGYGRAHRCALWGRWGVADAEDCLDAARHLATSGHVDPTRMAIRGGSAGGLTALNALAAGEGFAACASWYGVTDLLSLAATTHDFEAHYMDRLVGPLPQCEALYRDRSPLHHAAELKGSVLLLQGTEDAVVPPAQSEQLRHALRAAGSRCEFRLFEGEGHGFRRADTLVAAYAAELEWYRRQLNL
jgi:dipeptidyl aminopeptidase/acylaminoacyl peptidase